MWLIENIKVLGFQGFRDIELSISSAPNFFIGINGSGKTTLIELLNSALVLDDDALLTKKFKAITITFVDTESNKKPELFVEKKDLQETGRTIIHGHIKESQSAEKKPFTNTMIRRLRESRNALSPSLFETDSGEFRHIVQARSILQKKFKLTWLSIHRGKIDFEEFEEIEIGFDNPIEQKLASLQVAITRYFSALDNRSARATQLYQHTFFLSLLARSTAVPKSLSKRQIEEEEETLRTIFTEFGLPESVFAEKLSNHFTAVQNTSEKLLKLEDPTGNAMASALDMLPLFDTQRLHSLIEEWRTLEKMKSEIYEPKDNLQRILDDLYYQKTVEFTDRNSIQFISDSGEKISVNQLSSGEKQILILLLEATLQENRHWIYLADEPELSLHVDWQEKLVDYILALNRNAQIIFATHSPDIVSRFTNGIVRMESL